MHRIGPRSARLPPKIGATSISSFHRNLMTRLLCALLLCASLISAETALYIGGWPHQLMVVDESTYQVIKRIEMKTDVPRNLVLSKDHSKLVVLTIKDTGIETVDLAKQEVVDSFTLGSKTDSFSV